MIIEVTKPKHAKVPAGGHTIKVASCCPSQPGRPPSVLWTGLSQEALMGPIPGPSKFQNWNRTDSPPGCPFERPGREVVSKAGDVNVDAVDDLIIQAPFVGVDHVVLGNAPASVQSSTSPTSTERTGSSSTEPWGRRNTVSKVSGAGASSGDDIDDAVIGAPEAFVGGTRDRRRLGGTSWPSAAGVPEPSRPQTASGSRNRHELSSWLMSGPSWAMNCPICS